MKTLATLIHPVFIGKPNRVGTMVWRVELSHTEVRGLRGVAGLFSGTPREQRSDLGGEEESISRNYTHPYSGGPKETQQNPANPAGVESGRSVSQQNVEWAKDAFPFPEPPATPKQHGEGAA